MVGFYHMDIAAMVLLGVTLAAVGLLAGLLFADRRERTQLLADIAAGEKQRLADLEALQGIHNQLVTQVAGLADKTKLELEALGRRITNLSTAGRPGPTHGSKRTPG